jgi:hypothetical protein
MTRDQTTNFPNSAAPLFLGSIALARLNFRSLGFASSCLDGFRPVDRSSRGDALRLPLPGSCLQSPHRNRE